MFQKLYLKLNYAMFFVKKHYFPYFLFIDIGVLLTLLYLIFGR